jgi:Zn-dependent protease
VDISADQVQVALLSLIAFVVSVSVHEFGHAFVADKLGDRTPRLQGRLTLSPLAHIDPIGTIVLLIAWGKPVQTNPANYTRRLSPRVGHMLVSLAGPFMNLLLALVISVLFVVLGRAGVLSLAVQVGVIRHLLALNLALLFFNLIPLPPLDGAAVLAGVLPDSAQPVFRLIERYGIFLFFLLLMSGALRVLMRPAYMVIDAWTRVLLGMVGG